ncbi:GAF domain-containing protein [Paracoccus sp. M683]|uniref:adenylate/guanylate cyclase domain-containing protein n=1 Tax=Paracoccus sp. M683 TaxID=2594268 RepID=UPI00117E59D6|nr:GAF domain-containing protein [Paracoccus sp. M683]TRW98421.1 GAF domain-containing protein [Paracoccus sp. M683]
MLRDAGHATEARDAARQASRVARVWGAPCLADAISAEAGIADAPLRSAGDATLAATDLQAFIDLVGTLSGDDTPPEQRFARVAALAMRVGNADFSVLAVTDGKGDTRISCHPGDAGCPSQDIGPLASAPPFPRGVIELCLRTRSMVHSDDPGAEPYATGQRQDMPRALLCVPLVQGDRLLGALYLHSRVSRHAFAPSRQGLVQALANQAAVGLHNARLLAHVQHALESQMRQTSANRRFVPDHLMQALGQGDITDVKLNQHAQTEMTAVFVDIRGSTAIAQDIGPGRTIEMINRYLEHVQPAIAAHGGFVGNYMGDGLLALFPYGPDFALFGIAAMARGLSGYNANRGDLPHLSFGAGLHIGQLTLGMIGEQDHVQVGVLGTPVNVAARLDDLNKEFGSRVLVSDACVARLDDPQRHALRSFGRMHLRGLQAPLGVFELLDIHEEPQRLALIAGREVVERAVVAMQAGQQRQAAQLFARTEAAAGHDPVAARMAQRCLGAARVRS